MLKNSHNQNRNRAEHGQGIVEYALIIAAVALVAVLALKATGTSVSEIFCRVTGGVGGAACAEPDVCTMNFDDPADLNNWTGWDVGRTLGVSEGKLCNSGTQFNYFNACGNSQPTANFVANLNGIEIDPLDNDLHPGFDFVFRSDDQRQGYRFSYSAKSNVVVFWKGLGSTWVLLEHARVPADWVEQELSFQVKVEGDTFTAYKDGEQVLQATDDEYADGIFGWRNKPGSSSCIDGMSIQQLP